MRTAGLGRAFVGVADDVNTMNWNPSGLATLKRYEVTTMYASLFTGFDGRLYTGVKDNLGYNYVAVAAPFEPAIGSFGASWTQFTSELYGEHTVNVGYGRTLAYEGETFHVGANLKILHWYVRETDYSEALSRTGFSADLGVLYPLPENFVAGLAVENIIPANVGVTTYEEVPRIFRLGASWSQDLSPLGTVVDSLLFSAEWANRAYAQSKNTFRFGTESWFFGDIAAARLGVNSTEFTVGFSGQYTFEELGMTRLRLDYAFALPFYLQKTYGTHRVALTASWGKPEATREERAQWALEEIAEKETKEDLLAQQEAELAAQRAREQARLSALMGKYRAEIRGVREELERINELMKLGTLPPIQFESGRAVLDKTSYKTLDRIGGVLAKHPRVKVRLEGHTDSVGPAKKNQALSQDRVEAVKAFLEGRYDLDGQNIIAVGYGETRPVASNETAEGRAANRRVEIKVILPAGMQEDDGVRDAGEESPAAEDAVAPQETYRYEDLERIQEELEVYEMQMNPEELDKVFNQNQGQSGRTPQ